MPLIEGVDSTGITPPPTTTPPTVYWFRGKAYYSLAAYTAAVAAYNSLIAAQTAAAQRATQEASVAQQQTLSDAAEQQALRELAARRAAQQSAATLAAARDRALQLQRQQAADEQERVQLRQLQIAAAKRAAEQQALLQAQRQSVITQQMSSDAQDMARQQQARREAIMRDARSAAYNRLQGNMTAWRTKQQRVHEQEQTDASYQQGATAGQELAKLTALDRYGEDNPNNYVKQRTARIQAARTTGNWSGLISQMDKQSRDTGGRFVDQQMWNAVQDGYVAPVVQVGLDYDAAVQEIIKLYGDGKFDSEAEIQAFLNYINSPEFLALEERFTAIYGDGHTPGSFSADAETLNRIASNRERLWMAQLASGRTELSPEEVNLWYQQLINETQTVEEGGELSAPISATVQREIFRDGQPTGEFEDVKVYGLDAWIAEREAEDRRRIEAQKEQQREWTILSRKEGYTDVHFENGEMVFTDPEIAEIRRILWESPSTRGGLPAKWRLDSDGIPVLIARARDAGNRAEEEVLMREFMQDVAASYDISHATLRSLYQGTESRLGGMNGLASTPRQGAAQRVETQWFKNKNAWLNRVANLLDREWGAGERFSVSPLSDILNDLVLPNAMTVSALRYHMSEITGRNDIPLIGVGLDPVNILGVLDLGPLHFGSYADPMGGAAKAAFEKAMMTGNPTVIAEALRQYGTGWVQGNLGWILEGLADPTLGVGLSTRPLRLAALARLRAPGSIRAGLAEYYRLIAPRAWRGAERSVIDTQLRVLDLARRAGLSPQDSIALARLTDRDTIQRLWDRVEAGAVHLEDDSFVKALAFGDGINKPQLLNMIQQALPDLARAAGLSAMDPFDWANRIKAIRRAFDDAVAFEAEAKNLVEARVKRAAAMSALRRVRPATPVSRGASLTVRDLMKHERLVQEFVAEASTFSQKATRALALVDNIESGKGVFNPSTLRARQKQLSNLESDLSKYVDRYSMNPNGQRVLPVKQMGRARQRYHALSEYRTQIGGDPDMPSFASLSKQQFAADRAWIRQRIAHKASVIRTLPRGSSTYKQIAGEIAELQQALKGVEYEELSIARGKSYWQQLGKREHDRIESVISPSRIGYSVASEEEIKVAVGRDLHSRLVGSGRVRGLRSLSQSELVELNQARELLRNTTLTRGSATHPMMIRLFELLPGVDSLTLEQAWTIARLMRKSVQGADWEAIEHYLTLRVARTNPLIGAQGPMALRVRQARAYRLFDYLREEHIYLGKKPTVDAAYAETDRVVRDMLRDVRHFIRSGQVRPRRVTAGQGGGQRFAVFTDSDPTTILAKMRLLEQRGMTMWEYDELRSVLGNPMLKENTTRSLWARGAQDRTAMREAIIDRAGVEVERSFVDFASDFQVVGMTF